MDQISQPTDVTSPDNQQFRAFRQVTDTYVTPSGEKYEFMHDNVQIPANQDQPAGFNPETAQPLLQAEQKAIDDIEPARRIRALTYPVFLAGGTAAILLIRSAENGDNLTDRTYLTIGLAYAGLTALIVESEVYRNSRRLKKANARIADIRQNLIKD